MNSYDNTKVTEALAAELRADILRRVQNGNLSATDELMGYSLGAANVARQAEVAVPEPMELPKRRIAAPELLKGRLRQGSV